VPTVLLPRLVDAARIPADLLYCRRQGRSHTAVSPNPGIGTGRAWVATPHRPNKQTGNITRAAAMPSPSAAGEARQGASSVSHDQEEVRKRRGFCACACLCHESLVGVPGRP
jgi:hypothetical protein